jgi:hypothetical protein
LKNRNSYIHIRKGIKIIKKKKKKEDWKCGLSGRVPALKVRSQSSNPVLEKKKPNIYKSYHFGQCIENRL